MTMVKVKDKNFDISTLKDNNKTYNSYKSRANILITTFQLCLLRKTLYVLPNLDSSPYPSIDSLIDTVLKWNCLNTMWSRRT